MFQTTGSYFQDRLAEPGGLNEYVTEFFSLAFIYPYGVSVVIALLLGLISGCFFLYLKACGVHASMLAAILPSFLIWLYPQESIALLVMLAFVQLLAYLYTSIERDWARYLFGFLFLGGLIFLRHPLIYCWLYWSRFMSVALKRIRLVLEWLLSLSLGEGCYR